MAEYWGTELEKAIQVRMRLRHQQYTQIPGWINGGRAVAFDDPGRVGWDAVRAIAEKDHLVIFPLVNERDTRQQITDHLGPDWLVHRRFAYLGSPQTVLPMCTSIVEQSPLPQGWTLRCHTTLTDQQIEEVQRLNAAMGILPYPAFYSRGEAVPVLTANLRDSNGTLIASESAAMRYHQKSRLSGYLFAGKLSVVHTHRGLGYGRLMNATLLLEAHRHYAWRVVHQQTTQKHSGYVTIMASCGVKLEPSLVSLAAANAQFEFAP